MEGDTHPHIDFGGLLSSAEHWGIRALERLLEDTEEVLLGELHREKTECGRQRYVRHGRRPRNLVTKMGKVTPWVTRVRDRLTGRVFSPLVEALGLGRKRYTPELRLAAAELATRTSYEEASQALERTLGFRIPRRTIWDFLQELADTLEITLKETAPPPSEVTLRLSHSVDSTFVRGKRAREQHEVEVAITQGQDHRVKLVGVAIDRRPGVALGDTEVHHLTTDDAPGLRALDAEHRQLCHVHFVRHLAGLLGEEGVSLREREEILSPLRGLLAHLRNSVEAHRYDGSVGTVTERVRVTLRELGVVGLRLERAGCPQSARFVLREMRSLVVFAEVGRELWMPATSNGVERVMGMIADRCKRKWAHWNRGLHNMVLALLARKIRPVVYGVATRKYLKARGYG